MGGYRNVARGYDWCATIALVDAAGFVFLPWLLFGHGTGLGDLVLLPDAEPEQPWWQRAAAVLALVVAASIMALVLRNNERIDAWSRARLGSLLRRESTDRAVQWALRALGFAVVLGIFLAGFWATGQPITWTRLAFAFAVAFAGAGAGAGAVLALAFSRLGLTPPEVALAFALFLAVLPLLNALLDWPSWLVSRALGRDLLRKLDGGGWRQVWALLWHAAVDLFFAALFLVGLAALLPRGVSLFLDLARLVLGEFSGGVAPYLCTAAQDPLGRGLWASAMLFSTLLPTALHLMFLIASPFAFWARPSGPVWQQRAAYLCGRRTTPPDADLPESPVLREVALREPGPLRETATKVAWWRIRQALLLYPAALLLATGFLVLLWQLIQAATGSLPAWLLLVATGDRAFVDACLPGAL